MASSKLMASSTSQDSDLKSKLSVSASTSATDFLKIDNAGDNLIPDAGMMDGVSRSKRKSGHERVGEAESSCESDDPRAVRKTVDDVWKEIIEGKKRRQQPKEEMMTLEDFLMKAGAAEETRGVVDVKEEGSSGGIYAYESNSGVIGAEGVMGLDVGGLGRGRGKRSVSLLEPLDKAAQQRQRRMIKNRESAARSRERKQAYQVELESMSVRLEEENELLLKEKADRTKKRLKQLMESVIPVVERRRPPPLRKVRSLQW